MPVLLSATYDPSTDVGAVRLLLMDVDLTVTPTSSAAPPRNTWTVVFADEEIQSCISRYSAIAAAPIYVYYAAAELIEAMANNKAWLEKHIKVGDYERDTKQTAAALTARAKAMRAFASAIPAEAITDVAWTDANYARWIYNQYIAGM